MHPYSCHQNISWRKTPKSATKIYSLKKLQSIHRLKMNQFLITVLVASIVGSQFQISDATSLSTIIKIQSCNDNQYVGVPPKVGPATTTTTEAPTTTSAATTTATTTTGGTTTTTTPAPAPVVPIGGGGSTVIISWQVNWGNAVTNGTGSLITAVDTTTSENRCLGNAAGGGIAVTDSASFPTAGKFIWNFVSVFDSVSWTYKYKITNKANNRCLKKIKNGAFSLAACPSSNSVEFLYNIMS